MLDVTASTNCTSISDVLAGNDLTLAPTSGIDITQSATCVQDFGGGIVASVYPDADTGDPEGDAESFSHPSLRLAGIDVNPRAIAFARAKGLDTDFRVADANR